MLMDGAVWVADGGRRVLLTTVVPLLAVAAAAWAFTARTATMGTMGATAFTGSWLVMMTAMMLPAVAPVVGLYTRAARRGVVAPAPFFLAGYACIWAASAVPAYVVARAVSGPLMDGRPWVARLTGVALLVAGLYQLTPYKRRCLTACRSPLSFFLARSTSLAPPRRAFQAGVQHGLYCLGCCWALMAVLIVLGGMQIAWALALTLVITAEKRSRWGPATLGVTAAVAGALGLWLIATPTLLSHLITM